VIPNDRGSPSTDWPSTARGQAHATCQGADAAGNVQPEVPPWNRLGYGNNAVEAIYVDVH
jgi:hypothetical protein